MNGQQFPKATTTLIQKCPSCSRNEVLQRMDVNGQVMMLCGTCCTHVALMGIANTANSILTLTKALIDAIKRGQKQGGENGEAT
jgi:hypothetical protein